MQPRINSSDLKTILHSKRANIYYLEYCRVLVNGGRVEYVTDEGNKSLYWNIAIANTTTILLGSGTSITQAAMRELSKAGVLVGFCGSNGTPLYSATEFDIDILWFSPQSEYRPTQYLQGWVAFWQHEVLRVKAAKMFQIARIEQIRYQWAKYYKKSEEAFKLNTDLLDKTLENFINKIDYCNSTQDILSQEAHLTKFLYQQTSNAVSYGTFKREKNGCGYDAANRFLDYGNYLAYGTAATATWVLGIPHAFPVLHGKTRRGALVFDVADLIKDAVVLPQAFISSMKGDEMSDFKIALTKKFIQAEVLDIMINTIKNVINTLAES